MEYSAGCKLIIPPASGVALQSYLAARFKRIPPLISAESRQSATGGNLVSQNADSLATEP